VTRGDKDALGNAIPSGGYTANQIVDVVLDSGTIEEIDCGGTVTQGDPLTSDANGKAVKSTTNKDQCGGIAMKSGVLGDRITIKVAPFINNV
jgi:hypothetical protein